MFYHIIPENLKEYSFIVIILVSKHNHPPLLPHKVPYNIKNQLQKIIDNEHVLDLTRRKFLTGKLYKMFIIYIIFLYTII